MKALKQNVSKTLSTNAQSTLNTKYFADKDNILQEVDSGDNFEYLKETDKIQDTVEVTFRDMQHI